MSAQRAERALDFDFGTPAVPSPSTGEAWERLCRNAQTQRRKERLKARRNALQNAVEGLFVARGWSIRDAARMAGWWVADRLQTARSVMERYGYRYTEMSWRTA